ncbi:glycosyltransferase family 4 protein [Kaistella flava (ex Peng et al. 2021)]|uniref:Glycosyltransferase family 4 protein n=1 Tax=Kaistella flava (ex Peng et al. 2021) TaxID=2038776 RepID=A0A7M2YCU5_9FLAO|nr:glycosyltransferase [Kaistella flava (ex Peng et al. 2021)]QOW11282.1 glycosyltransferase family 4 protein [Kaistella flava (ex Peng et al. 2021)]
MRYKILFISSWFPNKLEPTNGNFVQRHAEAVSRLHDVEVLHSIGDATQIETYLFDDKIINGIRTLIVYYKNSKNPVLNFIRRIKAYQMGFSRLQKPDLVHANVLHNSMLFAVYLKRKFKIPFVITEHWSGFLKMNHNQLSKSQMFVAKIIANNAEFVLPVSQYLLNDLMELDWKTKFDVVGNVVDTQLFKLKSTSENKSFTFLHISNLIQLKNPEKIIVAALKLRTEFDNFELHIGGDGDVEKLNKIVKENKAENFIKTFSMLTLNEVAEKMSGSDCFILFSNYENFPCVLLESLSTGTPAIATKVGGIPEIINDKNGVLISNSEEELYLAIKAVVQKKVEFADSNDLHQFVDENFSIEIISKKFDIIYQQILS